MPELGEVGHAVALLRKYLLNKVITSITANPDEIILVKPLDATRLEQALKGAKVTEIGRHGKYFWFEVNRSRTILLHFGMTGWMHIKGVSTHFIPMEGGGDKKLKAGIKEEPLWPPKFTKFIFKTEDSEIAFKDARRLSRVRLIEAPAERITEFEPLKNLGIDWSQGPIPPLEQFLSVLNKRRVAVKALLLDQSVFSGIGNWMADEILFQSRIHPAQYCPTLTPDQVKTLYNNIREVCRIALDTEANVKEFPSGWLMLHRWGKGRKNELAQTPEGYNLEFVTVGGRTSCFAPELQILPKLEETEPDKSTDPGKKKINKRKSSDSEMKTKSVESSRKKTKGNKKSTTKQRQAEEIKAESSS